MNSKLISQIDTAKAVSAVCAANVATWTTQVAFAAEVPKLNLAIATATPFLNQLAIDTKGITKQKKIYKKAMADAIIAIIKPLKAYSMLVADPNITQEVNFSYSDIFNVRDDVAISRSTSVFNIATTLLPSLGNYGITAAKLTTLQNNTNTFTGYQTKPQEAIINKFDTNKELLTAVNTIGDTIDRMKLMAEVFKPLNITFYNKFIEATKVKQTGKRHDAVIGTVYDHNTHHTMAKVLVTYPGLKKPKKTGKKGGFRVKNLAAGTYQFTFTFNGYHPASTTVYVNAGVTTKLKVELVPLELPANQTAGGAATVVN